MLPDRLRTNDPLSSHPLSHPQKPLEWSQLLWKQLCVAALPLRSSPIRGVQGQHAVPSQRCDGCHGPGLALLYLSQQKV